MAIPKPPCPRFSTLLLTGNRRDRSGIAAASKPSTISRESKSRPEREWRLDFLSIPIFKPLQDIKDAWKDIPTFPAVATRGDGVLETFRALISELYRSLDAKHAFASKFALSEEDFLKGVMRNFPGKS